MSHGLISEWKNSSASRKETLIKSLKSLKHKDKRNISKRADKTHQKVFSKLDCLDCANCCTSIPPIVTRTDIKRIAKHLGLTENTFIENYVTEDEDGDKVLNTSPCRFLEAKNACSIYEVRPKACRAYPHTGDLEFLDHIHLHKININYCPAVFHILERLSHFKD